ncbi:MAG TPA: hypothetical protein VF426_09125 [Marmoricola sp.]
MHAHQGRGDQHEPEKGASSVEYAMIVSAVAGVIAATVYLFGGTVQGLYVDSCNTVTGYISGTGAC